jgi:hypothetical protein
VLLASPYTVFAQTVNDHDRESMILETTFYDQYPLGSCEGVEGASGAGATLDGHTLPASKGGTGYEEPINARGQVPSTNGYVTFAETLQKAPTEKQYQDPRSPNDPSKKVSMQELYQMYYITMRWRYVKWNWNGSSVSPGPEKVDFYSKAPRILITNTSTNPDTSIIAVVLEAGPAPWTGIDSGSNNNPKQGWKNPQDGTPSSYKGRVSGFPPQAIKDLKAKQRMADGSGDNLVYSWAADQKALPGPVEDLGDGTGDSEDAETCEEAASGTGEIYKGNFAKDTSQMKCAAGTDAGTDTGYANGKAYKIRLCRVQGIRVNALISEQVNSMLTLAKAQGRKFTGGGFRTMAEQISLRKSNGCPNVYTAPSSSCGTPTARPGYSNHQMGLAMDLSYNGNLIRSRSNAGFVWLKKNAGNFGFKNLPSEPWHWSVNGK